MPQSASVGSIEGSNQTVACSKRQHVAAATDGTRIVVGDIQLLSFPTHIKGFYCGIDGIKPPIVGAGIECLLIAGKRQRRYKHIIIRRLPQNLSIDGIDCHYTAIVGNHKQMPAGNVWCRNRIARQCTAPHRLSERSIDGIECFVGRTEHYILIAQHRRVLHKSLWFDTRPKHRARFHVDGTHLGIATADKRHIGSHDRCCTNGLSGRLFPQQATISGIQTVDIVVAAAKQHFVMRYHRRRRNALRRLVLPQLFPFGQIEATHHARIVAHKDPTIGHGDATMNAPIELSLPCDFDIFVLFIHVVIWSREQTFVAFGVDARFYRQGVPPMRRFADAFFGDIERIGHVAQRVTTDGAVFA